MVVLPTLIVGCLPTHLSAQELHPGTILTSALWSHPLGGPIAIGAAVLAVAAGLFLRQRSRREHDTQIPLIVDLDALSRAAAAAGPVDSTRLAHRAGGVEREVGSMERNEPTSAVPLHDRDDVWEISNLERDNTQPQRRAQPASIPFLAWEEQAEAPQQAASVNGTVYNAAAAARSTVLAPAQAALAAPHPARLGSAALRAPGYTHPSPGSMVREAQHQLGRGDDGATRTEMLPLAQSRETERGGEGAVGLGCEGQEELRGRDAPTPSLDASTDEPLQLLPGGIEILGGAEGPPFIRFFRTSALEVPEVTIGRSRGVPYRHIHLWAPSVSRMHARMRFERGQWKITNLSRTNPLRINGLVLDLAEAGCTLRDGDRIQLGEVVLCYREHQP